MFPSSPGLLSCGGGVMDSVSLQGGDGMSVSGQRAPAVATGGAAGTREQGYIATLKESFGFIEMADQDKEVFFHYRCVK